MNSNRIALFQFATLAWLAALMWLAAGCRSEQPPADPAPSPNLNGLSTAVAEIAGVIETATAAAPAIETPTPAPPSIVGRWRRDFIAEGLTYTTIIEFFADGRFSATVSGRFSPCLLLLSELCELLPAEMPLALTYTGVYDFTDADHVRLEIEETVDPTAAFFLKEFDQQLEAFRVARPDVDMLELEQDGIVYEYVHGA